MTASPNPIETYIYGFEGVTRERLAEIRAMIQQLLPDTRNASECIRCPRATTPSNNCLPVTTPGRRPPVFLITNLCQSGSSGKSFISGSLNFQPRVATNTTRIS